MRLGPVLVQKLCFSSRSSYTDSRAAVPTASYSQCCPTPSSASKSPQQQVPSPARFTRPTASLGSFKPAGDTTASDTALFSALLTPNNCSYLTSPPHSRFQRPFLGCLSPTFPSTTARGKEFPLSALGTPHKPHPTPTRGHLRDTKGAQARAHGTRAGEAPTSSSSKPQPRAHHRWHQGTSAPISSPPLGHVPIREPGCTAHTLQRENK